MSRKLSITYKPYLPKGAGKVLSYEVKILKNYNNSGLLGSDKKKEPDHASVITNLDFEVVKKGKKVTEHIKREVFGELAEVYTWHIKMANASQDLFMRAWETANRKNLASLTAFPFPQASTAEKLQTQIYDNFLDAREFAKKAGKDFSNVYRELKGQRKISLDQAMQYSKVLMCDPVDLLFEKLSVQIWGQVNFQNSIWQKEYQYVPCQIKTLTDVFTYVPRDIYKPNVMCVRVKDEGSHLNNHNLFYYKSDNKKPDDVHGKLCVVGVNVVMDGEIEWQEFFVGIVEKPLGKNINLINPDPFAEHKYIARDIMNVEFIAPVVAAVNPSLTKNDKQTKELLENIDEIKRKQKEEINQYFKGVMERVKRLSDKKISEKYEAYTRKALEDKINQAKKDLDNLEIPPLKRKKTG